MKATAMVFAAIVFSGGAASCVFATAPPIEILEFEGVAPDGRGSPFLTGFFDTGDFRVYTPYGQWVDSETEDIGVEHPDNGTDWFLNNNTGGIVITHQRSLPFILLGFDATEYTSVLSGGRPIEIDGVRPDGTSTSATVHTSTRPPYQVPIFQFFDGLVGQPLRSVTITQPNNGFAIDNIRLMAIPEPSGAAASTAALVSIMAWIGRNRLRS